MVDFFPLVGFLVGEVDRIGLVWFGKTRKSALKINRC